MTSLEKHTTQIPAKWSACQEMPTLSQRMQIWCQWHHPSTSLITFNTPKNRRRVSSDHLSSRPNSSSDNHQPNARVLNQTNGMNCSVAHRVINIRGSVKITSVWRLNKPWAVCKTGWLARVIHIGHFYWPLKNNMKVIHYIASQLVLSRAHLTIHLFLNLICPTNNVTRELVK